MNHPTIQPYQPEIRFADVDAYGIVHNAMYIVYLEQARIHWWRQVVQDAWDWTEIGVLVAHHDIDYVNPLRLGDVVNVHCRVGEVGVKSIEVNYTLECQGQTIAKARTVLVCFDHRKRSTTQVPDAWRSAFGQQAGA
ncbi:MAG: thioesterase family protein [Bacteroidetes bacterium]|nr:thioesterase family protein [Bacteroidota bacterium]MDA0902783.1 thioesterase family protein [Bacteroidota bacterium]MDA1243069.1 thioesterase family protein [Bacteroidota bacterium]